METIDNSHNTSPVSKNLIAGDNRDAHHMHDSPSTSTVTFYSLSVSTDNECSALEVDVHVEMPILDTSDSVSHSDVIPSLIIPSHLDEDSGCVGHKMLVTTFIT